MKSIMNFRVGTTIRGTEWLLLGCLLCLLKNVRYIVPQRWHFQNFRELPDPLLYAGDIQVVMLISKDTNIFRLLDDAQLL